MKKQKKICANCKKAVQPNSGFCGSCGAKLDESTIINASEYTKSRLIRFTKFFIIGIIFFVVFYLVVDFISITKLKSAIINSKNCNELYLTLSKVDKKSSFPLIFQREVAGNTICKKALETKDRGTLELAIHYGIFRSSKGYYKGKSKYYNIIEKEYYDLIQKVGIKPEIEGIFIDPRDKEEYKWIKIGSQIWMSQDMNYKTKSGSVKGYFLKEIGDVPPPGWHVPSDGDFQTLEISLGLKLYPDVNGSYLDAPEIIGLTFCSKGIYYQVKKDSGSTKLNFEGNYWTTTTKYYFGRLAQVNRNIYSDYNKEFFEISSAKYGISSQQFKIRCISDLSVEELRKQYELGQTEKDMVISFDYNSPKYKVFIDPEKRFMIKMPDLFVKLSESNPNLKNREFTFQSKDQKAIISLIVLKDQAHLNFNDEILSRKDIDCTYKVVKDNWFVLSGYQKNESKDIFYQKTFYSPKYKERYDLVCKYPKNLGYIYNDITAIMSNSFSLTD